MGLPYGSLWTGAPDIKGHVCQATFHRRRRVWTTDREVIDTSSHRRLSTQEVGL